MDELFNGAAHLGTFHPHDGMLYGFGGPNANRAGIACGIAWGIHCTNEPEADRIAACVNACAGIDSATLSRALVLFPDDAGARIRYLASQRI